VVFAGGMSSYFLAYKSDVGINRSSGIPPWERINPEEKQKLAVYRSKYQKIPEVEALREEIGSYTTK